MESEIYNEIAEEKYRKVENGIDIIDWFEINEELMLNK